jgi:biotin operon repressor
MNGFLSYCGGFTPVIDVLVEKYGVIVAAVYGVVWRYAAMRGGVCFASQQSIADRLGISRKMVNETIGLLCQEGLILDETPGVRNRPHRYRIVDSAITALLTERKRLCAEVVLPRDAIGMVSEIVLS